MTGSIAIKNDARKQFWKHGACSSTMFYILSREFGHPQELEVRAAEPLAGGIVQQGYQCGMLWGSTLALGAEASRRYADRDKAIAVAITATQLIMKSFIERTKSADCFDITQCDWSNKLNMAKYLLTGKFLTCFRLIEKWAPEAIQAAEQGLALEPAGVSQPPLSCASEVARKLGANDEEIVTVAGLAGGMGLSGNACAALGAALWLKTLILKREQTKKVGMFHSQAKELLEAFYTANDHEILCSKITGQTFNTIDEHTEFIKTGGCANIIDMLAKA